MIQGEPLRRKNKTLYHIKRKYHPINQIPPRMTPQSLLQPASNLLLSLEVVKENRALLGLLTPILNNNARAVDNLASVTLTVKLA
jgi:hypothetical protein